MALRTFLALAVLALAAIVPVQAQQIMGRASVVDGDTIEIHSQRIRLFGIDAVEGGQLCQRDGKPWRCARDAAFALDELLRGKVVICSAVDIDRYKRIVVRCTAGGVDVNGEMVRLGWAIDYPEYSRGMYARQGREARTARRGLWAGEFIPPWEWRAGGR